MSRKTKTELETENKELKAEDVTLLTRIETLEGNLEHQNSFIQKLRINFDQARKQSNMPKKAQIMDRMFEQLLDEVSVIQKMARSDSAKRSANARHALPLPTLAEVKINFKNISRNSVQIRASWTNWLENLRDTFW